jgi:peptidoglycan/LPS O-acetylase OafA/YrhL
MVPAVGSVRIDPRLKQEEGVIAVGIGVKELIIVLLVAMLIGGLVALLLPRKWVPLKAKRIILGVWLALGLVQLIEGAAQGGKSMFTYGLAEMLLAGGGLLVLCNAGWKKSRRGRRDRSRTRSFRARRRDVPYTRGSAMKIDHPAEAGRQSCD